MTDRHGAGPDDLPREHPADEHVSHPGHEDGVDDDAAAAAPRYDALLAGHGGEGVHDDVPEGLHDDMHDAHDDHDDHDLFAGAGATAAGRPRGRGRRFAVLGAALAVLLLGVVLAAQVLVPIVGGFLEKKDFDGPGTGSTTIVVHQGDTGHAIGETLQKAGVVKTTEAFEKALAENPGDEIQPGTYTLPTQMKAVDAVSRLRSGEARDEKTVTIREGLRAAEVYEQLSKATGVPVKDYVAAAKKPAALGLPAAAKGSLEGYLFPATYTFGPKATAAEQLQELVGQALARYSALGVPPEKMHQIVTIASIVESEARLDADRPKVAAVIENRLRIRMPLQLDSTVSYGVGKRTITTTDADRKNDNPYNTYLHPGLPAGPIDNPGAASVEAALHPAKGTWLYFVTVNPKTGETAFAETHDQHNANVRKFQAWCQANPGTC